MYFWLIPLVGVATAATIFLFASGVTPPPEQEQTGYRGVGLVQFNDPEVSAALWEAQQAPDPMPDVAEDAPPRADEVYQNVQVLGHLSQRRFLRLMTAMNQWIAPEQGCGYCHDQSAEQPFANDNLYTKKVARGMLEMTMALNSTWESHTKQAGVTCYTCHRGNNVPQEVWYRQPEEPYAARMAGNMFRQNRPSEEYGLTSLPYDALESYLLDDQPIAVVGNAALPTSYDTTVKDTESTYALMIHMSQSLNVNCTSCHNSRAFSQWQQGNPRLPLAWYGIRMTRDANKNHITPLADILPAHRKGPLGDPSKVSCLTCHQNVAKPLFGANMLADYPSLDPDIDVSVPAAEPEADDGEDENGEDETME